MTLRRGFIFALLGVMAVATGLAQEERERESSKQPVTELGQWMDKMNAAFRKVRRQVVLPEHNASTRELVGEMIVAAEKARALTPEKNDEVAEPDRSKFIEGYRAQMEKLLARLRQLDAALVAGDNVAASEIVRELGELRREAHTEYKKDPDPQRVR